MKPNKVGISLSNAYVYVLFGSLIYGVWYPQRTQSDNTEYLDPWRRLHSRMSSSSRDPFFQKSSQGSLSLVHGRDSVKHENCSSLLSLNTHRHIRCYPTMTKFYEEESSSVAAFSCRALHSSLGSEARGSEPKKVKKMALPIRVQGSGFRGV